MRSHGEKTFYTECEFSETEFTAIEQAKEQAILNRYGNCFLLGTGSRKLSHVYKVITKSGAGTEEMIALKVISAITQECDTSDLETVKNQLKMKLRGSEVENCAESEIKIQYDGINRCPNVIPLDGTDLLDWICPDLGRVGVDYVLKMPLADCLNNRIEDFKKAEDNIDKVIQLGIDICTALEKLHAQEIYHRDIKPANIYYYQGHYCLGDFGIAIHKTNLRLYAIGTEIYCAPEQHYEARKMNPWLCKKYDHRIDIYSLGLVLYELAGKKTVGNLLKQRMNGSLPVLSIGSEGLKKIIQTACQFDPDDRYQNATIFRENLERLQQDKNYIPSQEIGEIFSRTESQMNYQEPDGETCIGKEKDPYEDEFEPEEEKIVVTSVASNMWDVGLFWYEKSCESASRFANLKIDRHIMPLISTEQELSYDFPVKCHTKDATKDQSLSQVIANINNIGDMYLIGEGGSGKTTALYSIMQDTYKGQMYPTKYTNKITIPLFIELSKAPDVYGKAYYEGHSTFIRRYLYLLIKSAQQKKELLTEDKNMLREVFGNNSDDVQDDIVSTIDHLLREDNGIQYLLLLDGLNEVSRKEILFPEGSDTVVELVINEIRELQEYSNVTVVITSRADEAVNFGNDIPKYYLSGIDDATIKQYLEDNEISTDGIMQNARLLNTLRVPFFLKLYCGLMFKDGIMTPGEILYNFFKERTSMYSIRERINTIHSEQRIIGSTHVHKRITEKMQWFILDFILPEIGWYMEKNSLYTIDQQTIKIIVDRILTGTEDTDVCGKYGIAIFEDYHKGADGSVNTKTYAKYLMELDSENQTYTQAIIEYCVYSLGILYVNNQNYGFIHQHIRDFFAAIKNINSLKMALAVSNMDAEAGYHCLAEFNKDMIQSNVSVFIGEILLEYKEKPDQKYSLSEHCIDLYRKKYETSDNVQYGLYNLLMIIYNARKSLTTLDLSYLDLRNCHFNGIDIGGSIFEHSIICRDNLFPFGHTAPVVKAVFSNNGKYIYSASYDGTVKLWHTSNLKYIKTVIKIKNTIIENIDLSSDNKLLLISTPRYSVLYETETYTQLYEYKGAFAGVFDSSNQYLALAYYSTPIRLINLQSFETVENLGYLFKGKLGGDKRKNILLFSPDSRYFVFINTRRDIEIWNLETLSKEGTYVLSKWEVASIAFDSRGTRLAIAYFNSLENPFEIVEFEKILQQLKSETKENFMEKLREDFYKKYGYCEIISLTPTPDISVIKFIDNDKYFLTVDANGSIRLYDPLNNNELFVLQGDCSHQSSYISEYKGIYQDYIVSGGDDGTIRVWNIKTLQCIGIIPNGYSRHISDAKFSPDGKAIVIAAKDITVWNTELGTFTKILESRSYSATAIAFSKSGKFLAAGFEDGVLNVYEYKNEEFILLFEEKVFDGMISSLQFGKQENYLLIAEENSIIKIFNTYTMEIIEVMEIQSTSNINIARHSVFLQKDDSILYCNYQSIDKILFDGREEIESYTQLEKKDGSFSIYAAEYIACSPDNKYVAFGWHGGQIEIRSSEDLESCIAVLYTGTYRVRSIVFSEDSKYMAITARRSGVKIYETQTWKCIRSIHGYKESQLPQSVSNMYNNGHSRYTTCVDCYNDNQTFLSASEDGTVKLWKPFSEKHRTSKSIRKMKLKIIIKKIIMTIGYWFADGETISADILSDYVLDIDENFLDIYKCEYTLYYVPGLKLKNASIKNLHPSSDLSKDDYILMQIYGADVSDIDSLKDV